MTGWKTFTLHDTKNVITNDLSSQFFLHHNDLGKNRAEYQIKKLQKLNGYVKCIWKTFELPTTDEALEQAGFQKYHVVWLNEWPIKTAIAINQFWRKIRIKFNLFDVVDAFSRNDLGDEFIALDSTGEQTKENQTPTLVLIKFQSQKEWLCSKDNVMLNFNLADADYKKAHNW